MASLKESDQSTIATSSGVRETKRRLYERTIEEYLILREACENELHILGLNRVGQEKDMRSIIQNTAKHVGLQMPKGWEQKVKDPFSRETI